MTIAICDDEQHFLVQLRELLNSCCDAADKLTIKEFGSGEELLADFSPHKFDAIILDIEMGGISGIEAAQQIRLIDGGVIIAFLTSHQEFAIHGYEVNAFRYILKGQPEQMFRRQLMSIIGEYHQTHISYPIQCRNELHNIAVSDILYFEVFKRTIVLHTEKQRYEYYGRLSDIEKDSRLIGFVKPHKSYYVNLSFIGSVKPAEIVMKNGSVIPLSRNMRQYVTDRFLAFLTERC